MSDYVHQGSAKKRATEESEKKRKTWKGKTEKGKEKKGTTGVSRTQTIEGGRRGGTGKGGSVTSYTWPTATSSSVKKLPVPLKVVKKAVETGTLDDLYASLGKKAGQLRKWFKTYTGASRKSSGKTSKEASERSGVKPITGRKSSRKPSKEASERKNVKPIKRNKALVPSGKKNVPGPGPKVPPGGRPKPGRRIIPKIPEKAKLPLAVGAATGLAALGPKKESSGGRGTHTPYSVKKGDTLSEIARDKGTTLKALLAANNIAAKDANKLRIGQKLTIPGKVKDRKSVYQGMTKSQMAAMHMPKTKRSESMGGDIDPLHGTTRKKKHDVSKYSDMKKKKPIKKKLKKKEPNTLFGFEIDPPEGGREVKLPFGLGSYKTISDAEREKAFAIDNKRGGQIKGYKKGGKVKKVRKASRPRGVGIALRGWGKAMR